MWNEFDSGSDANKSSGLSETQGDGIPEPSSPRQKKRYGLNLM